MTKSKSVNSRHSFLVIHGEANENMKGGGGNYSLVVQLNEYTVTRY